MRLRYIVAALVFYTVWFVFGPSQRIRHLLVVYPIVMLCILAGAASFAKLSALAENIEVRFMKSRTPRPEENRAVRAVGRT